MAKDAKQLNIMHWSSPPFDHDPDAEFYSEHLIDHVCIAAIWGFKIFESIGSSAVLAREEDMVKYRALASTLGAGRITERMTTRYWFEGRELAVLYSALCNMQSQFLEKARTNMEKTLMRHILDVPGPESVTTGIRCSISCQASMMVVHTGKFIELVTGALNAGQRIQLSIN